MDNMRGQSLDAPMTLLHSGNNQAAYAACQTMDTLCGESEAPYRYKEEFIRLPDSPRSLERNRGIALVTAVAWWDRSGFSSCWQTRWSRRVLYESSQQTLPGDRVRMPGGSMISAHYRLQLSQPSVNVAIRDGAGRYLLIRHKRYITGQEACETPADRVMPEKSPEDAARGDAWRERTAAWGS